ncbi:LysR family transcriptional regulator [Desulfovibrio sp. OttesenSCG-928-C06]|nr:LysR family transcriptional regulator [Desulfovibrio sp. OttesenSCG-928-C06]
MSMDAGLFSDRRITLEQLRTFVTVAESGGFNAAGLKLGRSQSAVTQSLQKLEEYLECLLLERRQGHIIGLTHDGRRLLPEARKILLSLDNVVSVLRRPELSGHISLGLSNNFNAVELQMAIASCIEMNKGLRVEVISSLTGHLAQMLEQGALDMAIMHSVGELEPADRLLKEESIYWVAANPEAVLREDDLPLVLFGDGCAYREAVVRTLDEAGVSHYLSYVSASHENVCGAIAAGFGVGVLPRSELREGIRIIPENDRLPELPLGRIFMRTRNNSPIISRFRDFICSAPCLSGSTESRAVQ